MGFGTESLEWLALATTKGLASSVALELVVRLGSPRALLDATPGDLNAAGAPAELVERLPRDLAAAEAEARAIARAGASLVVWGDAAYPARLREIAEPPLALAVRGTLGDADEVAIAIVGTRRASEYG